MKKFRKPLIVSATAVLLAASAQIAAAPAPALSYVHVRVVGSSTQGWEFVSENQLSTTKDHGGSQLRAVTVEIGYGHSPAAKMNGSLLPQSANYLTTTFCNYSNFLQACNPGETVVGFVRYWNLDGYQNGNFWYGNTSTNSPWNTLDDNMTIL